MRMQLNMLLIGSLALLDSCVQGWAGSLPVVAVPLGKGKGAIWYQKTSSSAPKISLCRCSLTLHSSFVNNEDEGTTKPSKLERLGIPRSPRPLVDSGLRYRSDDWLANFLSIPRSFVLRRIGFHLMTNTLICALVVTMNKAFGLKRYCSIPLTGHSLLGGFMSLLLVFRTNSAYA